MAGSAALAAVVAFFAIAAPWYVLCYLKNGAPFVRLYSGTSVPALHFPGAAASAALLVLCPVMAGRFSLDPGDRAAVPASAYADTRRVFSAGLAFGLIFFSLTWNSCRATCCRCCLRRRRWRNRLEEGQTRVRWVLAAPRSVGWCFAGVDLPQALASGGLSRSQIHRGISLGDPDRAGCGDLASGIAPSTPGGGVADLRRAHGVGILPQAGCFSGDRLFGYSARSLWSRYRRPEHGLHRDVQRSWALRIELLLGRAAAGLRTIARRAAPSRSGWASGGRVCQVMVLNRNPAILAMPERLSPLLSQV